MKPLFFLAFVLLILIRHDAEAEVASLAEMWEMYDPEVEFESKAIILTFRLNQYVQIQSVRWQYHSDSGCTVPLTPMRTLINPDYDVVGVSFSSEMSDAVFNPDGTSPRWIKLKSDLDTNTVMNSEIYTETTTLGQTRAQIEYCLKFKLHLTADPDSVEVNFVETVATLFVDLTDGFAISGVEVEPMMKLVRTSNLAYEVIATLCSDASKPLTQGSIVCVQVVPEPDAIALGLAMRRIDSFTFYTSFGPQQEAIKFPGIAADVLTSHNSCRGQLYCQFNTVLKASFYSQGTQPVVGNGVATMQFGTNTFRRRLGEDEFDDHSERDLQEFGEAGSSEFDVLFAITDDLSTSDAGMKRNRLPRVTMWIFSAQMASLILSFIAV